MARGRTWVAVAGPMLRASVRLLRCLPRDVRYALLGCCRGTPGLLGAGLRLIIVRSLARSCGENVFIGPYTLLSYLEHCDIGNHVSIRAFCDIGANGGLRIGANVSIASGTVVLTTEHDYRQTAVPMRDAPTLLKSTTIEDDVWIGSHCGITAGVTIGRGSVVGLGSVVTHSIPPDSVAVGVPARVIARRGDAGSK